MNQCFNSGNVFRNKWMSNIDINENTAIYTRSLADLLMKVPVTDPPITPISTSESKK